MRLHRKYIRRITTLLAIVLSSCVLSTWPQGAVHAESTPAGPFVKVDSSGRPARWNPCATLQWKIAGVHPSRRLRVTARNTFAQVAATTGLHFSYAGRATAAEFASPPRDTIVVGSTSNLGMPNAGGMTNVFYASTIDGGWAISGARVAINPIVLPRGTRFSRMLTPIMLHEVGHAMGLAHVSDSAEIMYPQVVKTSRYTTAARGALVRVGATMGCLTPTASPG